MPRYRITHRLTGQVTDVEAPFSNLRQPADVQPTCKSDGTIDYAAILEELMGKDWIDQFVAE